MKNNEGLSEFMKLAYKCNKVRNIKEAFEEYPVEEEWHKGKVENILTLEEEPFDYNIMKLEI